MNNTMASLPGPVRSSFFWSDPDLDLEKNMAFVRIRSEHQDSIPTKIKLISIIFDHIHNRVLTSIILTFIATKKIRANFFRSKIGRNRIRVVFRRSDPDPVFY